MKQLTCEMCGSTELIKHDGVFVCQICGTKYSVEEAKKMIIEGNVDVSGSTVKIDQSDELKNLYILARRAKDSGNTNDMQKYYEQILIKDPNAWEANLYATYGQAINNMDNIPNVALKMSNCANTVLQIIKDNIEDAAEKKTAVSEVATLFTHASSQLFEMAKSKCDFQSVDSVEEYVDNCFATRGIAYSCGDYIISLFSEEYSSSLAVSCWKEGIREYEIIAQNDISRKWNILHRMRVTPILQSFGHSTPEYIERVRKYEPSYNDFVADYNVFDEKNMQNILIKIRCGGFFGPGDYMMRYVITFDGAVVTNFHSMQNDLTYRLPLPIGKHVVSLQVFHGEKAASVYVGNPAPYNVINQLFEIKKDRPVQIEILHKNTFKEPKLTIMF